MRAHCREIIAWARGADIQVRINGVWEDRDWPAWYPEREYRVKPHTRVGARFQIGKDVYILVHAGDNHLCLIDVNDGSRWCNPFPVQDIHQVSQEELQQIAGLQHKPL